MIDLELAKEVEADPEKSWLKTNHYHIKLNDEVIGKIDLRLGHNEKTYYGGNVGYFIEPAYRGHGYAAKACLALIEIAKNTMDYLIITCNPDNYASKKTCEKVGDLIEHVYLPEDNDMYLEGEREKLRYKVILR